MDIIKQIESAGLDSGAYDISREPYGRLLVSPAGLDIIRSDPETIDRVITKFFRYTERELQEAPDAYDPYSELSGGFSEVQSGMRQALLKGTTLREIGSGSEGTAYRLKSPKGPLVVKHYEYNPILNFGEHAIEQFEILAEPPEGTIYRTPEPYFATEFLCAMEDLSSLPDYFAFIKQHPDEEDRLFEYLMRTVKEDPLVADLGDVVCYRESGSVFQESWYQELTEEELEEMGEKGLSSALFIENFDPSAQDDGDRYALATVDVRRNR